MASRVKTSLFFISQIRAFTVRYLISMAGIIVTYMDI